MAIALGVRPVGQIRIEVGGETRAFDNLVLNDGWQSLLARMGGNDGEMVPTWLHFGTGESEPRASDSGLARRVASTTKAATSRAYGGMVDAANLEAYSEVIVRFDYAAGELTGEWTELGLSYDEAYGEPYNRALVRDENQAPVPLIVLSDQAVTVYVRLRLHLEGWGQVVDLSPIQAGLQGTLSMRSAIASASEGIWLKGLPLVSSDAGGLSGRGEWLDYSVPSSTQYLAIPWDPNWAASRIAFHARDSAELMSLSLSPALRPREHLTLALRLDLSFSRGG